MYCGECGTQNKKGSKFCEECGSKLQTNEKEEKTKNKVERKPLTDKQKKLYIAIAIVLVILFGGYKYLENETSPKKVVENYLKAVNSNNYKKLYKYSNYDGDKTFISQKQFVELMKEENKDSKAGNYVVGEVRYENGNLNAVVTVNTTEQKQMNVKLEKSINKKYFIFDNWTITDASAFGIKTVSNYKIKVPEGTVISYSGIKVKDKYIVKDKKNKESKIVVYELPQVFAAKTNVVFTYSTSKIKKELSPTTYNNSYTADFDEEDINKDDTKKIIDKSKEVIKELMNGIKDEKEFKDLKISKGLDETTEETYNNKLKAYSRYSRKLEAFEITDQEIKDINCSDGYLKTRISLTYNYSTNQVKDKSASSTVYVFLSYNGKDFEVNKITTLPYAGVY